MLISLLLLIGLTALYVFGKRHFSKWQRMGFAADQPRVPYGSMAQVFHKERPFGLVIADLYERFQEKIVGFYMFVKPTLLVRDAELARQILTTDFGSFHDRGLYVDEKNDPLSANLFNLEGQSWRNLRTKLTPSFSSGKLKAMFGTVDDVGDKLVKYLEKELADGQSHTLEIKSIFTTYAVDIVASVIFGLDIDSFSNPQNEFRLLHGRLMGNRKASTIQRLRNLSNFVFTPLAGLLARLGVTDPITSRLKVIVSDTIDFREKNNVVRKDLLQLLIQLKNTGKISDDNDGISSKVASTVENQKGMSLDMIVANSFVFYIAGSETTAATVSFTIYELAMYPEILEKAKTEVDAVLKKYDLKPRSCYTYEAIQDMKYLDLCVKETTRKYPGLPFLNRKCTKEFQVPNTQLIIPKGTSIIISLWGMHRDPKYFPNPQDYKPERFAEDSMDYDPVAFMPFGEGPRHCIAQRMGVVNVKLALAKILANFNIEAMPRKEVEYKFHTAPVLVSRDGLKVRLSKRWQ
ncbi:cytochrome P450 6d1-like [Haematobia irritans]|uniref:cytochrome P450 6d1-like n=1 Tax=Haematobia irritans TaxID=7368 RepID=UPI003F4F7CE6